jgi:hypothetical protein
LFKYYVIELQFKNIYNKKLTTMAEIIENKMDHHHEIPSMAKANAGLTLG